MVDLRASDADRERVVSALLRHHDDGRITTEELEERTAAAWGAKHVSELAPLTVDLPDLDPAPAAVPAPAGRERAVPRWPGRVPFFVDRSLAASVPEAMRQLLVDVAPPLHASGYDLVERGEAHAVFVRRRIPTWAIVPAVLAFPIGLLALLARTEERITIELEDDDPGGTLLRAYGTAPLSVRRAFAELRD